jgi:sugar/nucleoside kinase (ribokinase family)
MEESMAGIWTMGEILVEIMRPRPGVQLYEPGEFLGPFPSGAPAIFIDTVARLGHPAGIIGGVGADDFGRCLLERLQADGVDCDNVQQMPHKSTAVAFVTYFDDGSRKFIFHIDGTPAVLAKASGLDSIAPPSFFHVMGCSLMANDTFRTEIFKVMENFVQRGTKISFDPNIRPELLGERSLAEVIGPVLAHCAVLLPGTAELELLSGQQGVSAGVRHLFEARPRLEMIVVKRGKEGSLVYTREQTVDIPAYRVNEVDPTGAGDCFDAGFLCGLLEGKPLAVCGQIAAAVGALNAGAFGPMESDISPGTVAEVIRQGFVGPQSKTKNVFLE